MHCTNTPIEPPRIDFGAWRGHKGLSMLQMIRRCFGARQRLAGFVAAIAVFAVTALVPSTASAIPTSADGNSDEYVLYRCQGSDGRTVFTNQPGGYAACNRLPAAPPPASPEPGFPSSAKDFAHRYNAAASEPYRITDIENVTNYSRLNLGNGSYLIYQSGAVELPEQNHVPGRPPRFVSWADTTSICTWMIRAADGTVSAQDASATSAMLTAASKAMRSQKIIRGTLKLEASQFTSCSVAPTGL